MRSEHTTAEAQPTTSHEPESYRRSPFVASVGRAASGRARHGSRAARMTQRSITRGSTGAGRNSTPPASDRTATLGDSLPWGPVRCGERRSAARSPPQFTRPSPARSVVGCVRVPVPRSVPKGEASPHRASATSDRADRDDGSRARQVREAISTPLSALRS